jgi:hypothetical protein
MKAKPHASARQCLDTALRIHMDQQRALTEMMRLHRQMTALGQQQLRLAITLLKREERRGR